MKNILSFILGFIISLVLYILAGYLLLDMTFTLSGQTLTERENIIALYFYCILAGIIFILWIAFKQQRSKRKYFSLGLALSAIPAIIILCKIGIIYFGQLNYFQPFDKNIWAKSNRKPFNMAKTIAKSEALIGLGRKQIQDKLGPYKETARTDGETLVYSTDQIWLLHIDLKKDTAVKVYLYEPGLD